MAKKSKKTEASNTDTAPEAAQEIPAEAAADETEATDPLFELQNEVAAAKAEAGKNWDLYLRERADLENARKRHLREKEEAIRFANDRLLKEMIPVLDNLERAVEHAEQDSSGNHKGLLEGVGMTMTQFRKVLGDFGVKPIKAVGEAFDPNLHQAMGQMESAEQAPNTVVTEFQKGYLLHDRLLRPSLVMVAKPPAEANSEQLQAGESSSEEA